MGRGFVLKPLFFQLFPNFHLPQKNSSRKAPNLECSISILFVFTNKSLFYCVLEENMFLYADMRISHIFFLQNKQFSWKRSLPKYSMRHKNISPCKLFQKSHYSETDTLFPNNNNRQICFHQKRKNNLGNHIEQQLLVKTTTKTD